MSHQNGSLLHPWFLTSFIFTACATLIPLRAADPPPASVVENLSFNGQVDSEQANFVLKGRLRGVTPEEQEAKLIYSLHALAKIDIGRETINQTIELNARVFQGKLKEMVLALRGEGEVVQLTGPALKDWGVRYGPQGKRDLVIRPQDRGTNAADFAVTVRTKQPYDKLPFVFSPLNLGPENAALYDGTLEVARPASLDLRATNLSGLAPIQAELVSTNSQVEPAKEPPLRFRFSGSEYALALEIREQDPDARKVALENFQLAGEFKDERAEFVLTGQAVVKHPEGGSLMVLTGDAALTDYTAKGELTHKQGAYWLRFRQAGAFPIELKFNARITTQDNWSGVGFAPAPSALRPVTLKGLPADTQFRFSNAAKPERQGETFFSYLPSAGPLRLQWKEVKPEELGKLFYSVEALTQIAVGPGLMRQAHQLEFKVMQGELNQLTFELTGEGEVTRTRGDDILAWKIEGPGADKKRKLIVQLNQPHKDRYSLLLQTQTPLGVFPLQVQPLRLVPVQAVRYGGHLLVVNDGAVRLEVTEARSLSQISPELFPQSKELAGLVAAQRSQAFAYRFSGGDFSLAIQADNILPELSVSQLLVYQLGETEMAIDAEIELDIREAPLREFYLRVPADFAVARLNAAQLSDYFVNPDAEAGSSRLRLVFANPLAGRQVVQLRLEKSLTPTNGAWRLPALQPQSVKSIRGYVGVAAETGFRLTAGQLTGLTEIANAFFPKKVAGLQLAYRLRDEAWQATLYVERLALSIQSDVVHLFTVSEGIAYGSSVINYLISGTPVGVLKLATPPEYTNLEFAGRDVRNWRKTDAGYEVYLQTPVFGTYTLLATFDRQFGARSNTLSFVGVRPLDVQSEQGSVLVVSDYPFDVQPTNVSPSVIQLDPAEVPAEHRLLFDAPILAAYQYSARPFNLSLQLNSLAQGETVHQVVDRASLKTHVSRQGEVVTDARYFIKSKGLSHLRLQVPTGVRLWETKVNGAKAVPVADGPATLIPLPPQAGAGALMEVDLKLAAKSPDKTRVNVALASLVAPVLLTEWSIAPDEDHRLQFQRGAVSPSASSPDRSGFFWLRQLLRGNYGSERQFIPLLVAGLMLAGALAWRWSTKGGAYRWSLTHWVGASIGFLTSGAALYLLVDLIGFAAAHPIAHVPGITIVAPIQEAGASLAVQLKNTPVGKFGFPLWSAWPAVVGLALWCYLLTRPQPFVGQKVGWFLGWTLLCWATLRVVNGTPGFLGVVIAFFLIHVLLPAVRCQSRLPRRVKTVAPPVAGAATALILAGLVCGPSSFAQMNRKDDSVKSTVQSLVQHGRIQDGFVLLEAQLQWKTEANQTLDFLRTPAVLTRVDYPPSSVRLSENRAGGEFVYRLTAQKAGEFEITFRYQVALAKDNSLNTFVLPTTFGLVNRLRLEVDRGEVEVFSTNAVSIQTTKVKRQELEITRADLVLAPELKATIGWRPRGRDTRLEKAVFYAELYHLFIPTAGVIEGLHEVQVRPAQGQLGEVAFQVPAGLTVTDVQADAVSSWRFDPDQHALRVQFAVPQARPFTLRLRSQLATSPLPYEKTNGVVTITQAAGQVGLVGVATGSEVQLDGVKEQGLSQINLEDFPANVLAEAAKQIQGLTLRRAYRYAASAASVALSASAVQPDVRVDSQQTVSLSEDRVVLATQLVAHITRAGIFKLSFALPRDFEVESLSGAALSHWTEWKGGAERIITLNLRGKTEGDQSFSIALAGPGLGNRKEWEAPRLVLREANKQTGQLVVVPELGFRLHVRNREGLTQLDPQKAGVQQKGVLAFRLLSATWQLSFDIETVEPWIQVASLQDITVREGQVLIDASLDYQIENAGVKSLLVQIPLGAEGVHFEGDLIADSVRTTNRTVRLAEWEVKLQRRIIGNFPLRLNFQLAATNRPAEVRIAGMNARNANLQHGYLAVRASGRLQLSFLQLPAALQRTEWQSIPAVLRRNRDLTETKDTFSTLETDFELPIAVSRHEVANVLPARVQRVDLLSVVAPSGEMLTEGRLWLQPGDKRLLRLKVPVAGQFWYAFVNGQSAWPWRQNDQILLLLEKNSDPNQPTTVDFFYTCQTGGAGSLSRQLLGPEFDLPLENITWRVFVPPTWEIKDWESTLQLRSQSKVVQPARLSLTSYLQAETDRQKERSKKAETMLLMGNDFLQNGVPQQARRAYQAAWKLSQHDAAFNEDARVQLHTLKMQQALLGLNQRRQAAFDRPDQRGGRGAGKPFGRWTPGQPPAYTQQQAQQILEQNPTEDNAALMLLAERMIRQQDASVGKPEAIRAALPAQGKELLFTGSLQVENWAKLQVNLEARPISPSSWKSRLLGLVLVFIGFALLAALTRQPGEIRTDRR